MKRFGMTLSLVLFVPAAAFADVSTEEIRKLLGAGLSDEVILTFAAKHGPMEELSAADVIGLKAAGASDGLLKQLMKPETKSKGNYAPKTEALAPSPRPDYRAVTTYPSYSYYSYPRYGYSYSYRPYSYRHYRYGYRSYGYRGYRYGGYRGYGFGYCR